MQAIDGKGRVAIPAPLRAVIERNSGERVVVLAIGDGDDCLIGYDGNWSDDLRADIRKAETRALDTGAEFDRKTPKRLGFGATEPVPFDISGRFILPPVFRKLGKLDDLAFFYATGDTFEIWNPHVLLAAPGIDEVTKMLVRFHLDERGTA